MATAASTFTTWQALYLAMLNVAAEFYGGRLQVLEYTVATAGGSSQFKYRSEKEFRDGLEFVKLQAQNELAGASALAPSVGRTYAKNGGGRW